MESPNITAFSPDHHVSKRSSPSLLDRGSVATRNQRVNQPSTREDPSATTSSADRTTVRSSSKSRFQSHLHRYHHGNDGRHDSTEERHNQHRHRHLVIDTSDLDRDKPTPKPKHKHKHSKSRDVRLPRNMNQFASSSGARSLLPSKSSGKEKDREGDDGLLRPTMTRDTTRSRWGSSSTGYLSTGGRKGSLVEEGEFGRKFGLIRRKEITTMEGLECERERRKQGEESLRSALLSIGSLATDITRRLDYTYYNLLEKLTTLHATIDSFQELADSTSLLGKDFQQESTGLDQDSHKQLKEFKAFVPQIRKMDALEKRMSAGSERVEALGNRLAAVKGDIEGWERREGEWQARISRRLRIFWAVMGTAIVVLVVTIVIQTWPFPAYPSDAEMRSGLATPTNQSLEAEVKDADGDQLTLGRESEFPRRPPGFTHFGESGTTTGPQFIVKASGESERARSKNKDALQMFDEL